MEIKCGGRYGGKSREIWREQMGVYGVWLLFKCVFKYVISMIK